MAHGLNELKPGKNEHVYAARDRVKQTARSASNFEGALELQVQRLSRMPTEQILMHADEVGIIRTGKDIEADYAAAQQPQAEEPYVIPSPSSFGICLGSALDSFAVPYRR